MNPPELHNELYQALEDRGTDNPKDAEQFASWGIRLITLLAGHEGSTVHCSLSYSTIGNHQKPFEALSYAWGDPKHTATIQLNGHTMIVTKNLETALQCLRKETPRQLWIDALCINQMDIAEKNIQVARMWAIYQHASRTTIFLGGEYEESVSAFRLLLGLGNLDITEVDTVASWVADPIRRSDWQALLKLFRRSWWQRAWIIQEYAVARDIQFLCGRSLLQGDCFANALQNLVAYRFKATVPEEMAYLIRHVASTTIHHLWTTRSNYQQSKQPAQQAIDILYKFRASQASDPRDKVFSLHKLMQENPRLVPDYTQPVADVYISVVKAAVESSHSLEILSHHNTTVATKLSLPSWCPDWTVMRGKRILLWPNAYEADGRREAQAHFKGRILDLQGVHIGQVRPLARFPIEKFNNKTVHDELLRLYDETANLIPFHASGAAGRMGFKRTAIASRIRLDGPQGPPTSPSAGAIDEMWKAWSNKGDHTVFGAELKKQSKTYDDAVFSALCGRAIVVSEEGQFGIADEAVEKGDKVCIFLGGRVPLIVRQTNPGISEVEKETYRLIGEWFVTLKLFCRRLDLSLTTD